MSCPRLSRLANTTKDLIVDSRFWLNIPFDVKPYLSFSTILASTFDNSANWLAFFRHLCKRILVADTRHDISAILTIQIDGLFSLNFFVKRPANCNFKRPPWQRVARHQDICTTSWFPNHNQHYVYHVILYLHFPFDFWPRLFDDFWEWTMKDHPKW